MKTLATTMILAAVIVSGGVVVSQPAGAVGSQGVELPLSFEAVHVYVDSQDVPLAAYQFELTAAQGRIQIVGVENGEHPAFATPPYYDRKVIEDGQAERIIIAAFSTNEADQLPTGRTRIATVHLQAVGEVKVNVELQAAADPQGNKIQPTLSFEKGIDR